VEWFVACLSEGRASNMQAQMTAEILLAENANKTAGASLSEAPAQHGRRKFELSRRRPPQPSRGVGLPFLIL